MKDAQNERPGYLVPVNAPALHSIADIEVASYLTTQAAENIPADALRRLREALIAGTNPRTRRIYERGWLCFQHFCAHWALPALPADPIVVAMWISESAPFLNPRTIEVYLNGIAKAHKLARQPNPCASDEVRTVLRSVVQQYGRPPVQKKPILGSDIRDVMLLARKEPNAVLGTRNAAIVSMGFCAALRRSELASLDVCDTTIYPRKGYVVTVPRSKTDVQGDTYRLEVDASDNPEVCALAALEAWLECLPARAGPLFRRVHRSGKVLDGRLSGQTYALIIKEYAEALGRDPADYAGHSTRAGLITTLYEQNVSDARICEQSRHDSIRMMRRYIRSEALFRDGVTAKALAHERS